MAIDKDLVCPECGHTQPDGQYCELCGTSVSGPAQSAMETRSCSSCGNEQVEGTHCKECGALFGSPQVPAAALPGALKQPSVNRWLKGRGLILVGVASLIVVAAAIVIPIVATRSEAPVSMAEATTNRPSAVPETLPAIQAPTPLSLQDFKSVSIVKSTSSSLLHELTTLADLVGRYPYWNQADAMRFSALTGSRGWFQTLAGPSSRVSSSMSFTPAFEQTYRLGEGYRRATSTISSAVSLLVRAVNSRDASMFEQAKSQLVEATILLSSVWETASQLDAYGQRGNIQSDTN